MKSFRYAIGLLLYLLATTLNAGNVYVSNSWLDGNIVTKGDDEGKYYVTVEGGNPSLHVHSVPEKTRQTFIARVPKGHEVTMWSWQDVKAAIGAGHYLNTYATNDYTYDWTGLNYDVALGVNLDWLKYTIDFDGNGETSGEAEPLEDVIYTNRITLAENPFTKTGYTFKEWQLEEDPTKSFSNKAKLKGEDFGDVLSHTNKEMTLVAQWTNNVYAVTFDANGGTFDGGAGTRALNETYDEKYVLPDDPTRESYAFSGWTNILGVVSSDTKVTMPSNHTIFAKWTYVPPPMTYTISFEPNGATGGSMPDQKFAKGEERSLSSNTYERIGYTYLGWATSETESAAWRVKFADGAKVRDLGKAGETVRLFAVWTNNPYRVRYYPNGGAGTAFERTFAYDIPQALPADAFTREGYELLGWTTDPTNTVMFGPSQSVSNLTTEANVVVPLFAKWQSVAEDLGAFSVAADCDRTTADRDALLLTAGDYCTVVSNVSEQLPGANKQYVCLSPTVNGQTTAILQCDRLSGQGKLSFDYRVQISFVPVYPTDPVSRFTCTVEESTTTNLVSVTTTSDGWVHVEYDKRTSGSVLAKWIFTTYYNADDHDCVHIDNVAWLPDERDAGTAGVTFRLNDGTPAPADIWSNATYAVGKPVGDLPVLAVEGFKGWSTNVAASGKIDASWIVPATDSQLYAVWDSGEPPVPGPKDAPTIGGFASTADGFVLSFTSDARFDYRLLTTPILVPADWQPYGEVKQGTGEVLLFTVPGAESGGAEQGFFKVEVLRRGVE